jgi:multicomponent Na+:H+ antiporter subunit F
VTQVVLDIALAGLVLAMLVAIGRVALGPTRADRVLGTDFGFAVFIAGLAVLAVRLDERALVDLVLAATLIGFLSTVALAALAERSTR